MKLRTPLLLGCVALIGLTACDPYPQGDPNATRTRTGALTGALIGGAIAAQSNSSKKPLAVVAGALAGGALGGAVGQSMDRQAAALQAATSGNVGVVNAGDRLVVTMPQDLLFANDSASLRPDLQADLRAVAHNLMQYPNTRIEIIGHTDSNGDANYNRNLSQRRAASVANILSGSGVPMGRIATYGAGEDQPIATNLTPEGRAQNRRVEIIIRPIQ